MILAKAAMAAALLTTILSVHTAVAQSPAPPPSKDLLFLAEDVPAGLNYDGPSAAVGTTQTGYLNMMEPLIYYPYGPTEDGVRRLDFTRHEGRLAESWSFDAATITWTLHLRHGVKSCAGNEFTADDVVYSFARAKSVSGTAPIGWFLANVGGIKGFTRDVFKPNADKSLGDAVEKIDDYTVKIRQSLPNRLLLTVLSIYATYPFDSREMRKHATESDPWSHNYVNTTNNPSFGPYCLERWTRDDEFVLRANPDYYRGKAPIDRVIMKRVPQSSNRLITLRSGQADLTQRLTTREFAGLAKTPGVTVAGIYGNETLFLTLNYKSKPLDDLKIRQAIAYALPYKQIINIGYNGSARRWSAQFPHAFNGFEQPAGEYDTDPAKARQLLTDAGFPGGKGLEQYAGAFRLAFAAERESTLGPIATVIASALKDVGIPLEIDPLPQTQLADRKLVKKDLPMSISDIEKSVGPDVTYTSLMFFVSTGNGGISNWMNYTNPEVDRLTLQARDEPDDAKQAAIMQPVQNILQHDLAWVPIVETKTQWAFRTGLDGITWHPDNSVRFFDLHWAP